MALGFGGRGVEALTLGAAVEVDPRTGAASLRAPVPVPAQRGLAPSLALVYGSGAANSAFGSGWALAGLPAVPVAATRRLPRWDGRDGFELAGDELVPWLEATCGTWAPRTWSRGDWAITAWRSRRGATKVRAEQGTHRARARTSARAIQRAARVRVARRGWPTRGIRTARSRGERRTSTSAQGRPLPLKRIRFGNSPPIAIDDDGRCCAEVQWAFEVVFDFGDHAAGR
jgi:hypothetical protein